MDNLNKKHIAPSLIESINDENFSPFGEITETILDQCLDDSILKDIPIFGVLIKGYGFVVNLRDRLFLKKIALFLMNSSKISQEEKDKFLNKIISEHSFKNKVGENLLLLLERHNNFNKSAILGKFFASYIKLEINYDQFNRLANALDNLVYEDILLLADDVFHPSNDFLVKLHHVGLANITLNTGRSAAENQMRRIGPFPDTPVLVYKINELGQIFINTLSQN
jgi:hypothetical protein